MPDNPQPETARALLWRHGLPEDVIDGALCLYAQELADAIDTETRKAKAHGVLEPDKYRPCRDASAQLRAMAGCPWCRTGIEHDVHCPTPESHNWGCGCPSDRIHLHAESGVDTEGCDCGHAGMGLRWHGKACTWVKQLTEDARQLLADEAQQPETQAPFVTRVLELFSLSHADLYDGALFWRVDDGTVHLSANVSDVFAWGGADAEPITPDTLPSLEQAYTDLKAIDADLYLPELYAARQRGERPQGAAYPDDKTGSWREISALFDACGPERLLGLGNPKAAPAHKESTS